MRPQRWLHPPVPAKTRYRTNDPGTHAPPVAFSRVNFEKCSFRPLRSAAFTAIWPRDIPGYRRNERRWQCAAHEHYQNIRQRAEFLGCRSCLCRLIFLPALSSHRRALTPSLAGTDARISWAFCSAFSSCPGADLPRRAVLVDVEILQAPASPPVGLAALRTIRSVARVDADGFGCAAQCKRGRGLKFHAGLKLHLNASTSRPHASIGQKFTPKTTDSGVKRAKFRPAPANLSFSFHSVFSSQEGRSVFCGS